MALGYHVDQNTLNMKAAQTAVALRSAFAQVEAIAAWLANNPVVDNVDPLVNQYNYTQDEAYVLRLYFETWESLRLSQTSVETFGIGRKITGLE